MWWKLLAIVLFVFALNAERVTNTKEVMYRMDSTSMDSIHMTLQVVEAWERFYASQGIKFGRVVFAQYTWETDWGTSKIFKENHNGYGMKFRKIKYGEQYALGEKNGHAYYKNHSDSVKDYARWQRRLLAARPDVNTEEKYLQMLDDYNVKWCPDCRYAEDLTYTTKIKKRIQYLESL